MSEGVGPMWFYLHRRLRMAIVLNTTCEESIKICEEIQYVTDVVNLQAFTKGFGLYVCFHCHIWMIL